MLATGQALLTAQQCGEEIAELRTRRGWSRPLLIRRLCNELDPEDPAYLKICESWLARLESGRIVKVSRHILEALCRALNCNPQERARILLYADRNVLTKENDQLSASAEVLTYVCDRIFTEAGAVLDGLVGHRRARDLDETEMLELVHTTLTLIIRERQQ